MIWVLLIMRAIHIIAATLWFGFGVASGVLLGGMQRAAGEQSNFVARMWFTGTPFNRLMPILSITTVVTGLVMYGLRVPGSLVMGSTAQQIVLGIGTLFGLAAFGHGLGIGRRAGQYETLLAQAGDHPTAEQNTEIQEFRDRIARSGQISSILMFLAILGMVIPRYLSI